MAATRNDLTTREWDAQKEAENVEDLRVVIDEALTVFLGNIFDDPDRSRDERQNLISGGCMTRLLFGGFMMLMVLSFPRSASACSCLQTSIADAFAGADVVFTGRVVSIRLGNPLEPGVTSTAHPVLIALDVSGYWKGPVSRVITVTTPRSETSCGFTFERGRDYLVYGHKEGAALTTSLCSRTSSVTKAADDLMTLGVAKVPPKS